MSKNTDLVSFFNLKSCKNQSFLQQQTDVHIMSILQHPHSILHGPLVRKTDSVSYQGYKGIRQWPINLCTIPNDDKQNFTLCRLNEPINYNSIKVPKRIRKRYYKTLGIKFNRYSNIPSLPALHPIANEAIRCVQNILVLRWI